jgi:hypothetical protein
VLSRIICAFTASFALAGCAMFEPETRAAASPRSRVALKEGPPPRAATPTTKAKAVGAYRAASTPSVEQGRCDAPDQCALLLRLMVDDPNRSWIAQRPTLTVYANGTRPFAYLALKARLSCRELTLALDEAREVNRALEASPSILTANETVRVRVLNDQVVVDLGIEQADRCNGGAAQPTG